VDSRSEQLYEISRELNTSLDLDHVLDALLDAAVRLLSAPLGYIVLVDRESGAHFLRCTRGFGRSAARDRRSSVADWVLAQGRPLVLNPSDQAGSSADSVTGAAAVIGVPVASVDGVLGVVVVADDAPERHFGSEDVRLLATIANQGATAVANAERYATLQDAYVSTVRSLAAAIDAKDAYTRGHSDRVAEFAALVADRIGLSGDECLALELASYLHDVGKIGVSERVLHKPGRLDDAEFAEISAHPTIGATILEPVEFPWEITPIVRHHHERWDGAGYPSGLAGEAIPLLARILTVADSHEAMVSDRPYRKGMPQADALAELRRCAGTQFDARIVTFFCDALAERGGGELGAGSETAGGRDGASAAPSATN
jgi:putative nucleotidyltransferase with HDIG domain